MFRLSPAKSLLEGFEMRIGPDGGQPTSPLVQGRLALPNRPEQPENQLVARKPTSILGLQADQEGGVGGGEVRDPGVAPQIVQPLGG